MNKKYLYIIIILTVVVVALLGGAGYFIYQNYFVPKIEKDREINLMIKNFGCEKFSEVEKQTCELEVISSYAVSEEDPSMCKRLNDSLLIDYCYGRVATELENPKICEKINDNSIYSQCYYSIAIKLNDENLCGYVKDNDKASMCYVEISKSKGDVSICAKIKKRDTPENFYYNQCIRLSVNMGQLDCSVACEKTLNEGEKNECYIRCAREKSDVAFCEKIYFSSNYLNRTVYDNEQAEIARKNTCYGEIAIQKKDTSLCDKIMPSKYGNSTEREDCIKYVQQLLK